MHDLPGISPEVSGHDIKNLYCLLQESPLEECGKHSTWCLLELPEEDRTAAMSWLLLSGLPNKKVAFSTGESLNEGLCSLPGLTQCQSLWLWSASEPNPSLEGWLAAVGDSSKFLSRLYQTDFISFWLLLYDALPNSASEFFQCLHCPHVAFAFTFYTSKCLASCLP